MAKDYQNLYLLASGLLLQERKLDVTANNLANVNTPGFKKDLLVATSWYVPEGQKIPTTNPYDPSNNYVYPIVGQVRTVLSQGSLVKTGNSLDFAIEGKGFFGVMDGEGNVLFTRKGLFRLDEEGYLVTEEGYRVLDEGFEPIQVAGEPVVTEEGEIFVDGEVVGRLGVWRLEGPEKVGEDFFTGSPLPAEDYRILQGFYEASNVNAIREVVRIIESVRAHEMFSKLVQMLDELQGKINNMA